MNLFKFFIPVFILEIFFLPAGGNTDIALRQIAFFLQDMSVLTMISTWLKPTARVRHEGKVVLG